MHHFTRTERPTSTDQPVNASCGTATVLGSHGLLTASGQAFVCSSRIQSVSMTANAIKHNWRFPCRHELACCEEHFLSYFCSFIYFCASGCWSKTLYCHGATQGFYFFHLHASVLQIQDASVCVLSASEVLSLSSLVLHISVATVTASTKYSQRALFAIAFYLGH